MLETEERVRLLPSHLDWGHWGPGVGQLTEFMVGAMQECEGVHPMVWWFA